MRKQTFFFTCPRLEKEAQRNSEMAHARWLRLDNFLGKETKHERKYNTIY